MGDYTGPSKDLGLWQAMWQIHGYLQAQDCDNELVRASLRQWREAVAEMAERLNRG